MDNLEILKSLELFSRIEVPHKFLKELAAGVAEKKFSPGEVIFSEGESADNLYFVIKGEVVVTRSLRSGQEKLLATFGPQEIFGEMAFFLTTRRTATVRAKTESVVGFLNREHFLKVLKNNPEAGLKFFAGLLEIVMERLEQTSRELTVIYETSKIIGSGQDLSVIVQGISEWLLIAASDLAAVAFYSYNEFTDEYELTGGINISGMVASLPAEKVLGSVERVREILVLPPALEKEFGPKKFIYPLIDEREKIVAFWIFTAEKNLLSGTRHLITSLSQQLREVLKNLKFHKEIQAQKIFQERKTTFGF